MNVSQILVKELVNARVKQVFGVTGDALNHFVKRLDDHEEIEWVGVRHEENAAFAAYAQGELSGLGVCAGTVGPGALHLINGLYSAKKERSPVLAITGQIEQHYRGKNYFQEINLERVFDDLCDYQAIIRDPKEAHSLIRKAIRTAVSSKSICRIEISRDLAGAEAPFYDSEETYQSHSHYLLPNRESVEQAADLIKSQKRITLLAGNGCREAREEVLELSKMLNAPIVHTLKSADIFDHDLENVVGLTGLIGLPSAYKAVMNCDLLIMLGTDFPYEEYLPKKIKVIQVDLRNENIGNRITVDVGIQGHILPTLEQLIEMVEPKPEGDFLKAHQQKFHDWKTDARETFTIENDHEPMHPQIITQSLDKEADTDAIFCLETSTAAIWAARHITFSGDRRILGSFNHGSMGVGFPAALGAQMSYPEREVWVLSGDGGFGMCMHDFITAVNHELPIKTIIFNNASLQLINLEMENDGEAPNLEAAKLKNPDFAAYAKLCGGDGIAVEHSRDLPDAIHKARISKKPFVIDARVSGTEIPMPPHIGAKDALDLTMSKIKSTKSILSGNKAQLDYMIQQIKGMMD